MTNSDPTPLPTSADHSDRLAHRLESLELQLERLTELMAGQAAASQRRRRRITLRLLLGSFVGFAIVFAWFGSVYHQSRRQAAAVDTLVHQSAFLMYEPRESALVSLLPGDPARPTPLLTRWLGEDFFRAVTNVSTQNAQEKLLRKKDIFDALPALSQLKRLRLTNIKLASSDLMHLQQLPELQSLDVTRTQLDSGGLPWMHQTSLRWFNASHTQIGDQAMIDVARCKDLKHLVLERTCVTDQGLKQLHGMTQLQYLNLKRCPVTAQAVKDLAKSLRNCVIEWEPLSFRANGSVDSRAAQVGRVRYNQNANNDPRNSHRVMPPMDNAPSPVWPVYSPNVWSNNSNPGYPVIYGFN